MEDFEQITRDAVYAVAVFGNLDTESFELIDLPPLGKDTPFTLPHHQMPFLGVIGIVQGRVKHALNFDVLSKLAMINAIAESFALRMKSGWELARSLGLVKTLFESPN